MNVTLTEHEVQRPSLGNSPAFLTNRPTPKANPWCRKTNPEYDRWCDPENPKDISYKQILKAASAIKEEIHKTPLQISRNCDKLEINLHYKLEFHHTGSFKDRAALYVLSKLSDEHKQKGVITASLGNWALALAYYGKRLEIPVTVVLPTNILINVVEKCENFGALVIVYGKDLAEAKRHALTLSSEKKISYINGYDHPHVIAACGSIGLEIIKDLPQVDVIMVPIGGGGLIAGIAVAAKRLKPSVLIYGVESDKNCSFFKALVNERPFHARPRHGLADALEVPEVGCNAFHTARSLIDKMIIADDDWITRSILYLAENEKIITEGAGAASFSPLIAIPHVVPELYGKTVVCVISGGNIDMFILPHVIERAQAIDGRWIKLRITMHTGQSTEYSKVLSMIKNIDVNVLDWYTEPAWLDEGYIHCVYMHLICETQSLDHACTLKRVMDRLFPDMFEFTEEPYSPLPICPCFPKRYH